MPLHPKLAGCDTKKKLKFEHRNGISMICAACEARKHFECIDCMNSHKTHMCSCDCHDENTQPHPVGSSH